jgi:hypothetical protein
MEIIARYHHLVKGPEPAVDEATWADLAMDRVFAAVDRTSGMPGRQVLYHQMRTYEEDGGILLERARQRRVFREDASLREACLDALRGLDRPGAGWLASLIMKDLPQAPPLAWTLYLASGLSFICLVGMAFSPLFLVPTVILALGNLVINETFGRRRIAPYLPGFQHLGKLLAVAGKLAALLDPHGLPQLLRLRQAAPAAGRLARRVRWLGMDRAELSEMGAAFLGYLNLLFLFDGVLFLMALPLLQREKTVLRDLFDAVGSLDAALSAASFEAGAPCAVVPTLVEERRLQVRGLLHPLLASPVGNSFQLLERSSLITGSNMAGKTTFIRTVGVNLILARTLHLCLAEEAVFPKARVLSAIRREDRMEDGKSYFFMELERILTLLQAARGETLHLFLIDELFRGTNTVERLAAATAVLGELAERHTVLATTHDLELQELLGDTSPCTISARRSWTEPSTSTIASARAP